MIDGWDSDAGNDYGESDSESIGSQIDSEIEIALYGQIHHISDLQNPDSSCLLSHSISEIKSDTCKSDSNDINHSTKSKSLDISQFNESESIDINHSNKSVIVNCCSSSDSDIEVISKVKTPKEVITVDESDDRKSSKKPKPQCEAAISKVRIKKDILKSVSTDVISVSSSSTDEWLVVDSLSNASNDDISINVSDEFVKFLLPDVNDSGENWVIDEKDRCSDQFRPFGNRYYQDSDIQCKNCSVRGHLANNCPTPKKTVCYMCGKGGHNFLRCKERVCDVCGSRRHPSKQCKYYSNEPCGRCGVSGHLKQICPDLWRQYYLTTELSPVVRGSSKKKKIKYCYNCSQQGHYGHCCPRKRMWKRQSANIPFIISYDDILWSSKKKTQKRQNDFDTENIPKKMKTIPIEITKQKPQIKNLKRKNNKKQPISVTSSSSVPLNSKINSSCVLPHHKTIEHNELLKQQKRHIIEDIDYRLQNVPIRESSERTLPIIVKTASAVSYQCVIQEMSGHNTSQNEKLVKKFERKYNDGLLHSDDNSSLNRMVQLKDSGPIAKKQKIARQLLLCNNDSFNGLLPQTVILDKSDSDIQILDIVKKPKKKKRKKKPFFRAKNLENSHAFQLSENASRRIYLS